MTPQTNQEEYSRLFQKICEQYKITEYNKKVIGLNALCDMPDNLNVVSIPVGNNSILKIKGRKNGQKDTSFKTRGAVKAIVRNYVKTFEDGKKFNILEILPELEKIDPYIKQQTVAGVLKKWEKESRGKNANLGVDGILYVSGGAGPKPTIYKKRSAV